MMGRLKERNFIASHAAQDLAQTILRMRTLDVFRSEHSEQPLMNGSWEAGGGGGRSVNLMMISNMMDQSINIDLNMMYEYIGMASSKIGIYRMVSVRESLNDQSFSPFSKMSQFSKFFKVFQNYQNFPKFSA